jgi:hypothetical protein
VEISVIRLLNPPTPLTPQQLEASFQAATLRGLGLASIAYDQVRVGWQQQGQPFDNVNTDVVYLRVVEDDEVYNRQRDLQYLPGLHTPILFSDNFLPPRSLPLGPAYVYDPSNGYIFGANGLQQPNPGDALSWNVLLALSVENDQEASIVISSLDLLQSNFSAGVFVRAKGTPSNLTSYYAAGVSASSPQLALYKVVNGVPGLLQMLDTIAVPSSSKLTLRATESHLSVLLNDVEVLSADDTDLDGGTTGFLTTGPSIASFSSTAYTSPPRSVLQKVVSYQRTWRVFWTLYGPNSFDRARRLKSWLLDDAGHNYVAGSNVFLVTDVSAPRRVPEEINAQWWERVDFEAQFNENVVETSTADSVASAEVIVESDLRPLNALGVAQQFRNVVADITVTSEIVEDDVGITWTTMIASGAAPSPALTMGIKAIPPAAGELVIALTPLVGQTYCIVNKGTSGVVTITDGTTAIYQLVNADQLVVLAWDGTTLTDTGEWLVVGEN